MGNFVLMKQIWGTFFQKSSHSYHAVALHGQMVRFIYRLDHLARDFVRDRIQRSQVVAIPWGTVPCT